MIKRQIQPLSSSVSVLVVVFLSVVVDVVIVTVRAIVAVPYVSAITSISLLLLYGCGERTRRRIKIVGRVKGDVGSECVAIMMGIGRGFVGVLAESPLHLVGMGRWWVLQSPGVDSFALVQVGEGGVRLLVAMMQEWSMSVI